METKYRIEVTNNSPAFQDFCVYQTNPDIEMPDLLPLAWLVDGGHPTTTLAFEWTEQYSFFWAEVDDYLYPGVVLTAGQTRPADLSDPKNNSITLDRQQGAYTFIDSREPDTKAGALYVRQTPQVLRQGISVGIAVDGSPAAATAAEPKKLAKFKIHPKYWLTADLYTPGTVIDVEETTDPFGVEFDDTPDDTGAFVVKVAFTESNGWAIVE